MHRRLLSLALGLTACAGSTPHHDEKPVRPLEVRAPEEAQTIALLREGRFSDAEQAATMIVTQHPDAAEARAVRAIARYKAAMHQLTIDVRTIAIAAAVARTINQPYLRSSFSTAEAELARVDDDLMNATDARDFTLELCIACWEVDWNQSGAVDDRDRALFEVEVDASDQPIPNGDPRRRPTFRFDFGDLYWARAMVAFQRAILDAVLARDLTELDVFANRRAPMPDRITIRVVDEARQKAGVERLKDALAFSRIEHTEYLAETDDDREWMPNPRQKNHPLPLPVDDALYENWRLILDDLDRLMKSDEGIDLSELAKLAQASSAADLHGFADVGRFIQEPRDIVLELKTNDSADFFRTALGDAYVEKMHPSPLPARLSRMKDEVDRGKESLERKLKYLLWMN
jgi:hypothetical protein